MPSESRLQKIEISHKTIIFTVVFLAFLWFVYFIRDVIFQVFVSLLIMTILNPTVTKLQKYKVPRSASVILVYVIVIGFFSLSIALLVPPLVEQTKNFTQQLPVYLEELKISPYVADQMTKEVASSISTLSSQLIKISVSVVTNILAVITVFIFALYFLLARDKLDNQLVNFVSDGKNANKIKSFLDRLEYKLGGWARGEIFLMFMVGLATYIGLLIIGIPFALPLALLAGTLEIIPNIGPIIAGIPPVLIGFGISPFAGAATIVMGILIQQLENYFLVPKVMERSVGISPIITLLSLLIGFKVAGIIGAMLSIPIVITTHVFLEEIIFTKK